MKRALTLALLLFSTATFAQTNSEVVTNFLGTKLSVPVITSALWRSILPTETLDDFLITAGLTNQDGFIRPTNNSGSTAMTNVAGVVGLQSVTPDLGVSGTTNASGGVTLLLTNTAIASLTSADGTVIWTFSTNGNGSISANATAASTNLLTIIREYFTTNILYDDTAINDGYVLTPFATGSPSNTYYVDFAQTNSQGQHLIFAELSATIDAHIAGITNAGPKREMSFEVYATSGNRIVTFPTNLFLSTGGSNLLSTNDGVYNMFVANGMWNIVLTNGHLMRFGIRSNLNGLEPMWRVTPNP